MCDWELAHEKQTKGSWQLRVAVPSLHADPMAMTVAATDESATSDDSDCASFCHSPSVRFL